MKKYMLFAAVASLLFTVNTFAVDPDDNYLAGSQIHNKYTGLNAVRDHVISGAVVSRPLHGYYGQPACPHCNPFYSCPKHKSRSAWANYIGRDSQYRSSLNRSDWDFSTNGVQVGTDIFRTCQNQLGAFFGFEDTNGWNVGDKIDAQDYYLGLYGVHVFKNGMDLRTVFNFGWQEFDTNRSVQTMSFSGNTAELNVELGKRRYFGSWSARPVVAIDWFLAGLDGGQESGGTDNMLYDSTDVSQLFFRFGTDLRYEWNRWAVEGGLYYSYDMQGETLRSGYSLNTDSYSLVGSKLGRSVLSYNLGGSWTVCSNFALFGGYRGEASPERAGDGVAHLGYFGGTFRW